LILIQTGFSEGQMLQRDLFAVTIKFINRLVAMLTGRAFMFTAYGKRKTFFVHASNFSILTSGTSRGIYSSMALLVFIF
jgi:hypothetical protein